MLLEKGFRVISLVLVFALSISLVPTKKVQALTQQEQEDIYRVNMFKGGWNYYLDILLESDNFVYHRVTEEQELKYNITSWNSKSEMKELVASLLEISEEGIKEQSKAEVYSKLLFTFFESFSIFVNQCSLPFSKITMIEEAIKEVSDYYLATQGIKTAIKTNSGDIDYDQILKQVIDRCNNLSSSEKAFLTEQYTLFVQSSTWLNDVKGILKIVSVSKTILEVAKKSLSMLAELETYKVTNDHILVLLQNLADHTSDSGLKQACLEMKKSLTQTYEENLIDGVERIVVEGLFDYAKDGIKDKVYGMFGMVGVMAKLGISCGKEASNAWFNTDDQVNLMRSIWCVNQVTEVLVPLINDAMAEYDRYTSDSSYKAEKASLIIYYVEVLQTLREHGELCYYNLQMNARSSIFVEKLESINIFDWTGLSKGRQQVIAWYQMVCGVLKDTRNVLLSSIDPILYLPAGSLVEEPVYKRLASDFSQTVPDGIYTFKNYLSGKMLNVYAGTNADGTDVVTWKFDGTTDQRFYVKHISDGQYVLYAVSSLTSNGDYTRCIDVYTGGTSIIPSDGDNIDIWTRSSSWNKSQLFYIVPVETGGYVLELCSAPGRVLGADNPYEDGGNISVQNYIDDREQKWKLCDTTGSENFEQVYDNTHINTGDFAEDLLAVATTQIGYKELCAKTGVPLYNGQGTWYTKYGDRFNDSEGAWCAYFVMWCAEQAGIPQSVIPQSRPYGNCGLL